MSSVSDCTRLWRARPGRSGARRAPPSPRRPPEHRRGGEQTFLTFPEWFLVYSPAEYAAFVKQSGRRSSSRSSGTSRQFWQSYRAVYGATDDDYPLNAEYHVMITVIGIEHHRRVRAALGVRDAFGRLTELTSGLRHDREDRLGARVAQDYVDFIRVRPWYEFDFFGGAARTVAGHTLWGPTCCASGSASTR